MPDIEIKRGYEVLPDNNVRFGIRVINNSDFALSDVEVILDYTESLFDLEGHKIQKLGTIPPTVPRTVKFILKPLGCIHKENVGAMVIYKDHQWKKHTIEMNPKEVHCVCPFLKEKSIKRADFLTMSKSGYFEERGVNFEGITVDKLVEFLSHTCNRLYKVDEFPIENGKILYLAGDALGEKAYYLLTVIVKEYEGLTQVLLRANSDKNYGLNGFLNEILDNLRHLVISASAKEIGIIRKEQVINIIDSVVQRSSFSVSDGAPYVNVLDSFVQRAEIKDEDRKKREDDRQSKERKEKKNLSRQMEEETHVQRDKEDQKRRQRDEAASKHRGDNGGTSRNKFYAITLALSLLALGYWGLPLGVKDIFSQALGQKTITNSIGMDFISIPAGEFNMGSPIDESYRGINEGPVHSVKISNAFYLGKYEVTQKQWREVMGSNPSYFKGDNLPVEQVSWNDVQDFIKKLNKKEGVDKYRLPTEAEWEYAARAGTATLYSFGDDENLLGDYAWYDSNSGGKTHDVGQKKPNPWGLYDMLGNVREWGQDKFHNSYSGAPTDGSSWESEGGFSSWVNRGCSWISDAGSCRSATRGLLWQINDNITSDKDIGFRLLRIL